MGKKLRKWYGIARKPLIWFLAALLVFQMFPAQGMAYAVEEAANAAIEQPAAENEVSVTSALPEDVVVQETAAEPAPVLQASDPEPAPAEEPQEPAAEPTSTEEPAVAEPTGEETTEEVVEEETPAVTPEENAEPTDVVEPEDVTEPTDAEVTPTEDETEETEEPAVAMPAGAKSATVDGVVITVSVGENVLPEGWSFTAVPVTGSKLAQVESAIAEQQADAQVVVAFDITLRDSEGNEIQPADGSAVNVTFRKTSAETNNVSVYHVSDRKSVV